jgi:ABC-type maltose transport system permease subunit
MYYVPPIAGETQFLRLLLTVVSGPEHLRTVNGIVHPNFRAALLRAYWTTTDVGYPVSRVRLFGRQVMPYGGYFLQLLPLETWSTPLHCGNNSRRCVMTFHTVV